MSSLSFLYQNSFSFLLSAGLRLHAPVTRSYQQLIVCNLWLLHFFTPFPDLWRLLLTVMISLEKSVFPTSVVNEVLLSAPWGRCANCVQIVIRQGCLGKGRGWKLKSRVLPTPFTFLFNGRTFLSLLSLFYPLLTDSILLSGLSSICFDAQIASDLANGNTFKGAPVCFWQIFVILVRASFLSAQ